MAAASNRNPYDAYNFLVEITGVVQGATGMFTECILPVASIDVIEYREGADSTNNVHKLPGLVRYGNLVLKRGLADSMALWNWFTLFVNGTGTPTPISVTLFDRAKTPVIKWKFNNAWPVKYESPPLNAKTSHLAIETLEIAVDSVGISGGGSQET